jgi:hypothetical protein
MRADDDHRGIRITRAERGNDIVECLLSYEERLFRDDTARKPELIGNVFRRACAPIVRKKSDVRF